MTSQAEDLELSDAPTHGLALAIDVGATKLASCLVDPTGTVIERHTVATPTGSAVDAETVWSALEDALENLQDMAGERPIVGVGIGSAGPVDLVEGTVSPINIPSWRRFPLVDKIIEAFPGIPVRLAGDGIAAAAGEHWRGGSRGSLNALTLVVSTGLGGGLVMGGKLVLGATGNAGHVGHLIIDLNGRTCVCGARGCLESVTGGPAMVAWALENGWQFVQPENSEASATAIDLAAAARRNDEVALEAFRRSGRALAAGIASVGAICDLTVAIIGGGVAHAADILFPPLRASLHDYARLAFLNGLDVKVAELGTSAGLIGAAAMIFEPDRYYPPVVS